MKKFLTIAAALIALASVATAQDAIQPAASPKPARTAETERVVVVGGAIEQSETDKAQSVTILNENTLKQKAAPTLGDTLANEPGVAASGFTVGASRPVIRGQADNRVRVLNNGTEVFDVSNLSPDHAPSVSALLSQSIEVVRGPATILFGSGAIGGVVNVSDNVIPVEQPPVALSGEVDGRFDSADFERSGAIAVTLSPAKHWVFHMQGSVVRTEDRSIPGFALDQRIQNLLTPEQRAGRGFGQNPEGTVPNTYVRTKDYAFGASYVWDKGYIGASFTQFLSVYGVPDDPEVDDPTVPPVRVRLDVDKRQVNARSSIVDPFPWLSTANAKFVYTDYRHDEIDGDTIGSTFKTNGVDSRLELVHKPIGPLEGSIGGQFFYKELSVLGAESFLQPTQATQIAAFLFEEWKLNQVRLQFGARVEHQAVHIDSSDPALTSLTSPGQQDQDFLPVSGAAGVLYDFAEGWQLAVNGTYSQRAPTTEELFARGPHAATFQFIIGNPNLSEEKNVGIDVSLRKSAGAVTGSISGFYNHYDGFIDFAPTGDVEDGLQVFVYTPKTAEFYGAEARADFHFLPLTMTKMRDQEATDPKSVKNVVTGEKSESQKNPNDLFLRLQGDYVHATDLDTGQPLPRITPLRFSASLTYETEKWNASIEGQRVDGQDRVAPFEISTPGYTFLNASIGYKFRTGLTNNYVYVKGTNLTNEEARDHLSFLKEVLPLAGRGVVVGFRTTF
ncbi:MAG: iron complex outerrane recepter protein [Verrucomicrobiota bacterium]|jgi:iron complex outermembrane receptor protein